MRVSLEDIFCQNLSPCLTNKIVRTSINHFSMYEYMQELQIDSIMVREGLVRIYSSVCIVLGSFESV